MNSSQLHYTIKISFGVKKKSSNTNELLKRKIYQTHHSGIKLYYKSMLNSY